MGGSAGSGEALKPSFHPLKDGESKMGMKHARALLVVLALGAMVSQASAIESISYGEQVIGPQKHAINIRSLGPDLYGEEISSYTGGISFSQTDLSLPGNSSLSVGVTRRLIVDGNKSPSWSTDSNLWGGYAFGEWELDLPYITGMYSETQGWIVNTSSPQARCSSPINYNQYRPKDILVNGYINFSSYNFWSGLQINVPGGGEEQILHRPVAGSLPTPSVGSWTALTTKSQWRFGCLSSLQSGQAGEGFLALAPDGTRYWFNWMVSYADRPMKGSAYVLNVSSNKYMRLEAEVARRVYRLYPTRVEDRFGNHVAYTWSGSNLATITSSDGRTISLTYASGRVVSAAAGSQTIQYGYANGLLTSVLLPDGSQWGFSTSAVVNLPRYVPLTSDAFDYPMECQLMRSLAGTEANLTMTHPSGAQGVYRLGYNRLYRSNLDGSTGFCGAVNAPDGVQITWRERQPLVPTRYDVLAVKQKTLSGPGLPANQVWLYQHQDTFQYKLPEYYPINGTRTATTTQPDGSTVVEVFGTDALVNEAQLLSREVREGANVLTRQDNTYVQTSHLSAMPFPNWMGEPLEYEYVRGRADYNRPLLRSVTRQQGRDFIYQVDAFDALTRPTQTTRNSQPSP